MSPDARQVLDELITARNARSAERTARMLCEDARYWDTERGDVTGRDAVAEALTGRDARLELETLAGSGDDAVLELQVHEPGAVYRATEVYRLHSGDIASIKSYFDPAARNA